MNEHISEYFSICFNTSIDTNTREYKLVNTHTHTGVYKL